MMRENSSASESSSGRGQGRTSRPASFPNMNFGLNAHGMPMANPNSNQVSSKKIRDVTVTLRNMNFLDKNKTKRSSLTDSEASDTASGRSRGAGGSVVTSWQNAPNQRNMKNKKRLNEIRADLANNINKQTNPQHQHVQYEVPVRVDVARETVSNAIEKKMKQETDEPNNYGDVYYQVAPANMYQAHPHKEQMGALNTLSRGSPDGASYRADSPSTFHTMHNPNMMVAKQQHYEPVHPVVLPTGGSNKYMVHPTTEPPAYPNMSYEYSGPNSCAGSDNSSSTGGSQYLQPAMNYNQQQHMQHQMYENLPPNQRYNLYPAEQRPVRAGLHYVMQDDHPGQHPNDQMSFSSQQMMDESSLHRPIIKGNYNNPPPSYNVSQNFKNKQIQSNEQTGIYSNPINSALTGNINAIRYDNMSNSHHNNQPYQNVSNEPHIPSFTSVPGATIRQAVSSQPVSKPRAMTAQVPTVPKENYYGGYVDSTPDHPVADTADYSVVSHQNPHYAITPLQDRLPPPYVNKRNSANLEHQFAQPQQHVQVNNNNGTMQHAHYEKSNAKSDNSQKSKVAEMYLNAVEKGGSSRNATTSQQTRSNTNIKYNQAIPQDAESAAKAARVTGGGNTKRSAGSYSAASSAKQLKPGSISEPPSYPSKPIISTSPVPQRKSYRDKTGKKHQEIQRMREVYSSSEDEDEGASAEEAPRIRRVRVYSPEAFKFYMEQHMENIIKSMRSRNCRRMQLEYEMSKMNLPEEEQNQMRKMLFQKESNHIRLKRAKIHKNMFQIIKKLGVGAFGEVMLARRRVTGALFAIKILKKKEVLNRNQVAHVKAERDILAEADNDWVVRLYYTFQDREHLFFVMDYIPGGDLMSLLIRKGIFSEELALFYTAEMCQALESVHKMGFIHRDIKPDNILIDRDGHIKLSDFGLCTGFRWTHDTKYYLKADGHKRQDSMDFSHEWKAMNIGYANKLKTLDRRRMLDANRHTAQSLVGTPNYIAPEVLLREGYTELCDWWSVGVILYEMVIGQPPFNAISPAETQIKVIHWRDSLVFPHNAPINPHTKDLIKRWCCDKENRLGRRGAQEIKDHPYFHGIQWNTLRQTKPPFVPQIKHAEDTSNFDTPENEHDIPLNMSMGGTMTSNPTMLRPGEHAFFEFTFRRFFDDDGRAYQMGTEEIPSGAEFVKNMEMEDQKYEDKYNNHASSSQNNEQSYNMSNYYTNI